MLYYDRTDVSQRIGIEGMHDFNSTGFFNHGFEFQDHVYIGCHILSMLSVNIIS